MNKPSLTIIIPCFNIADYLPACLDSIINQTYQNYSVILIDDGSTDETSSICDKYCASDARFHVIHQENIGTLLTRKVGVKACDTEYLTFVDGDDLIHPNMHQWMMNDLVSTPQADIVMCNVFPFFKSEELAALDKEGSDTCEIIDHQTAVLNILKDEEWKSYMWNKIFRRSLFDEISYPSVRNLDEDYSIMHLLFHQARYVLFNSSKLYYYRQRQGSICLSFDAFSMSLKSQDRIAARWERLQFVENHSEYQVVLNKLRNNYLAVGLAVMRIVAKYPSYFPMHFFDKILIDMRSVQTEFYMKEYFTLRKRIELWILKNVPTLFKAVYKIFPAW